MLESMKNADAILLLCGEIDRLESEADFVFRSALAKLFREESDVKQIIKLKEVYQLLESVTDKCEDVANVIEGIVLENADRPVHGRPSDDRGRSMWSLVVARAGVRLHERLPRRGELDRDHRLDARAAAALRGRLGGVLQLHRLPVLRAVGRQHHRQGRRRSRRSSTPTCCSAR